MNNLEIIELRKQITSEILDTFYVRYHMEDEDGNENVARMLNEIVDRRLRDAIGKSAKLSRKKQR